MAHHLCPFCNHHQTITAPKYDHQTHKFFIDGNAEGQIGASFTVYSCSNPTCLRSTVYMTVGNVRPIGNGRIQIDHAEATLMRGRIIPIGAAKAFPSFIPAPLLEDYREACSIKDLSPKAAATLVRRCLQGMIRDFCGITKARLVDEISELKERLAANKAPQGVSDETIEAIDHVRGIGNIGAHMERDIGLIIPVEPEEAEALIGLVELLFEEWYVARQTRADRLKAIKGVAAEKAAIKAAGAQVVPKARNET